MLSDSSLEIRQQADAALSEFLQEIKNSPVSSNPPVSVFKKKYDPPFD
jgi:hypothetical protein